MTRILSVLTAAILLAPPAFAAGIFVDLPNLTFPATQADVTQSTSGTKAPVTLPSQD